METNSSVIGGQFRESRSDGLLFLRRYFVFVPCQSHIGMCAVVRTFVYYCVFKSDFFMDFNSDEKLDGFGFLICVGSSVVERSFTILTLLKTRLCLCRTPKQPRLASDILGRRKLLRWCSFDQFIFDKVD